MDNIIIRQATLSDLEALYVFEQGVITAERPFDPSLKTGLINYYNIEELITAPHSKLFVAETNGKLIGSGYGRIEKSKPYQASPEYLYLGFMYVVPEYRGKEVNKRIIEKLKKWVYEQKIFEIRLDVYVNNITAIKAYEKIGFSKHMMEMRLNLLSNIDDSE